MADPQTRQPVLTLDTVTQGMPIRIDDTLHELLHPEQLSLGAIQRIERMAPRVAALLQTPERTEEQERDLSQALREVCATVLQAPADVHARLTDQQRVRIVEAFTQLRTTVPAVSAGANAATPNRGRKRSPDSPASTAAPPPTGSGARPSAC
jgi:hypothetical protein